MLLEAFQNKLPRLLSIIKRLSWWWLEGHRVPIEKKHTLSSKKLRRNTIKRTRHVYTHGGEQKEKKNAVPCCGAAGGRAVWFDFGATHDYNRQEVAVSCTPDRAAPQRRCPGVRPPIWKKKKFQFRPFCAKKSPSSPLCQLKLLQNHFRE